MPGRFFGTIETKIREDLVSVDGTVEGIERLIADIGTKWGRRRVTASDSPGLPSSIPGAEFSTSSFTWVTQPGRLASFV